MSDDEIAALAQRVAFLEAERTTLLAHTLLLGVMLRFISERMPNTAGVDAIDAIEGAMLAAATETDLTGALPQDLEARNRALELVAACRRTLPEQSA